jgi:hypothetical protein
MLSCNQHNKNIAPIDIDMSTRPVMHGEDISSLISDSGITRFRLETKVWDIYANDTASYWHFPQGIRVEQFDSLFQTSGYVQADTAYYFEKTGLWRLVNNVFVRNMEGVSCETSELFWNSKEPASSQQSIYTDKFAKITMPDRIVTTVGFKSSQSMTDYILYDNTMETEIDKNNPQSD